MQIGDLDRRITIQQPKYLGTETPIQNNYGEQALGTYTVFANRWANARWEGGSNKDESDKVTATTKVIFTIRNIGFVADDYKNFTAFRILMDSTYYYIKVIRRVDGREQFLELETELKK